MARGAYDNCAGAGQKAAVQKNGMLKCSVCKREFKPNTKIGPPKDGQATVPRHGSQK